MALLACVLGFAASPAFGETDPGAACLAAAFGSDPGCVANDTGLANPQAGFIYDADGGCASAGDTVTFDLIADLQSTAATRYDVGIYIGETGDALSGALCSVSTLETSESFSEDADTCGDIKKTPALTGVLIGPVTAKCVDLNGDGTLEISACTAWDNQADDEDCSGPEHALPGTTSKCSCGSVTVPNISVPEDDCTADVECQENPDNPCTINTCNTEANPNVCVTTPAPTSMECRASAGVCDVPEFCDGQGACAPDGVAGTATECRASAGVCDVPENCDGTNVTCPADAVATAEIECRASAGSCDVPENCDGTSVECPADGFADATVECRASGGICDVPENCTGAGAECPADGFAANSVECRGSAGICDVPESCTGNGATCPADGFAANSTECRASAGICDVPENCTGAGATCPADGFAANSVECRGSAGICDVPESCTGNGATCPADGFAANSIECRASAGICDVPESCSGSGAECPADGFAANSVECRGSAGICDVPESCTGNGATCPADGFAANSVECRASAGICDVPESCNGSGAECPADGFAANSVECRASAGICDVPESCTGNGATCPADGKSVELCRAAAGVCDLPENCDGVANDCPADDLLGDEFTCRIASGECDQPEVCDGENANCPEDLKIPGCEPEICRTAGFWSTHGGVEKNGKNVTQAVLDSADPDCPIVCGEVIDDTNVNSADSVLEATCVSIEGADQLQLARQLTAAALNCIVSQGNPDCTNVSIQQLFQDCNQACANGELTSGDIDCIAAIDCFNNGGEYDGTQCIIGTCAGDLTENATPCTGDEDCTTFTPPTCVRPTDTCHDQPIASPHVPTGLEPTGGASSSKACNQASKNQCIITGTFGDRSEASCAEDSETCNESEEE